MGNLQVKKTIFQVRYKPELQFYNALFNQQKLFDEFPHWSTDKLKILLKDYDLKHSIAIEHNKTTYELDLYNEKIEKKFIDLIRENISNYANDSSFKRFGFRRIYLYPVKFKYTDLCEIVSIKSLSSDFLDKIGQTPNDTAITIFLKENDYEGRLTFGPVKKVDLPQIFKFNIENHINPDSINKFEEINNILVSYPEVSIYFDYDVLINVEGNSDLKLLTDFINYNLNPNYDFINSIIKFMFEDKIK